MVRYRVKLDSQNTRLDIYLNHQLPLLSRAFIQKLTKLGQVLVNKQKVKTGYKLKKGDVVEFMYDNTHKTKSSLKIPTIYEDDDCIVIDKPPGVLTHSKGAINEEETVASWLQNKVAGLSGNRAGIVHRLDRGTSGVMIGAKNKDSQDWLQKQFSKRNVKKTYYAVVSGQLGTPEAILDMPIERNPKAPSTFRTGPNGKPAITNYKVISHNKDYSLLELRPLTGRTHQLRVHLSKIGHPILGDTLYGGREADRMYLHAYSLEITLPDKQRKIFTASLPTKFDGIMSSNDE